MKSTPLPYAIGFDLGGTRLKSVALLPSGDVLAEDVRGTGPVWKSAVPAALESLIARVGRSPYAMCIAAPGIAASDARSIAHLPHKLPGVEGYDWARELSQGMVVPVVNDAHAALEGEAWLGAARGYRHALMLTLGTGVGGAILSDGQILAGAAGRAGHFGHMTIDFRGACGEVRVPGSLECAVGDAGLASRSGGAYRDARSLVADVRRQVPAAQALWFEQIRAIGASLASLVNALDPECIILGGGIAEAGELLFAPLIQVMDNWEWRPAGRQVPVVSAQLGDRAGAYGACHRAFITANLLS